MNFLESYTLSSNYFDYPDGINYANDNYCLIKFYLENSQSINKYIVKSIKKIYDKAYYGNFNDMMRELIDNNKSVEAMIYQ